MRIFLNLLAANAGGQLTRAQEYISRFEKIGSTTKLIVLKDKHVLKELKSTDCIIIVNVPIGTGIYKALRRTVWENMELPKKIKQYKADVYLTFSHYMPCLGMDRIPSVVGVSNLAPFVAVGRENMSWAARLKLIILQRTIIHSCQRASYVLALSETCRKALINHGIMRDKIYVTPNGVGNYWAVTSICYGLLKQLGIKRQFLLYVSHFYEYKNYIRLIKAYAEMPKVTRKAYQLILVGKPYHKYYFNKVALLITNLGLSNDVLLMPGLKRNELRKLYQSTTLFVFPSLIENCPNILLEAMMSAAPVVGSNLQPITEFGGTAVAYFNPFDITSIKKTILKVLNNKAKIKKMKDWSHLQAKKYSWDDFVLSVNSICQLALCKSKGKL